MARLLRRDGNGHERRRFVRCVKNFDSEGRPRRAWRSRRGRGARPVSAGRGGAGRGRPHRPRRPPGGRRLPRSLRCRSAGVRPAPSATGAVRAEGGGELGRQQHRRRAVGRGQADLVARVPLDASSLDDRRSRARRRRRHRHEPLADRRQPARRVRRRTGSATPSQNRCRRPPRRRPRRRPSDETAVDRSPRTERGSLVHRSLLPGGEAAPGPTSPGVAGARTSPRASRPPPPSSGHGADAALVGRAGRRRARATSGTTMAARAHHQSLVVRANVVMNAPDPSGKPVPRLSTTKRCSRSRPRGRPPPPSRVIGREARSRHRRARGQPQPIGAAVGDVVAAPCPLIPPTCCCAQSPIMTCIGSPRVDPQSASRARARPTWTRPGP